MNINNKDRELMKNKWKIKPHFTTGPNYQQYIKQLKLPKS